MDNARTVQITSRIVTCINIIEIVISAYCLGLGVYIAKGAEHLLNDDNQGADGIGQIFFGIGGLFGTLLGYMIIFLSISAIIYFLIPAIRGIVLWVKTPRKMEEGMASYYKAYRNDGIVKTVFNGLPAVFFVIALVENFSTLQFTMIGGVLVLFVVPAISIYQIIVCVDGGKQE